jgi:hypothetical protein
MGVRQRGASGVFAACSATSAPAWWRAGQPGIVDARQLLIFCSETVSTAAAQVRIGGKLRQQRGQSRHVARSVASS